MPDNHRSPWSSTLRVNRTQRSASPKGYTARGDVDEVSQRIGTAQRKADRETLAKRPPVDLKVLLARFPDPIFRDLSVDAVCQETLMLVDLLGMDNVEVS